MAPPECKKEESLPELRTVRPDPRFPHVNQTKCCYTHYCDYWRCKRLLGEGCDDCELFRKYYTTICPNEWVEKWDGQREAGKFPGRI